VDGAPIGDIRLEAGRHRHVETVHPVPGVPGGERVRVRIAAAEGVDSPPLFLLKTRKRMRAVDEEDGA